MDTIYLHEEQRRISKIEFLAAHVVCQDCGNMWKVGIAEGARAL